MQLHGHCRAAFLLGGGSFFSRIFPKKIADFDVETKLSPSGLVNHCTILGILVFFCLLWGEVLFYCLEKGEIKGNVFVKFEYGS